MSSAAWLYPGLLHVHIALVTLSIGLFAARGIGVGLLMSWPLTAVCRHVSVLIDTLLMSAGIGLWVLMSHNPIREPWLGVKLLLLLAYIVLGSYGLKRGSSRLARGVFTLAALACVLTMYSIATSRHPLGWLA